MKSTLDMPSDGQSEVPAKKRGGRRKSVFESAYSASKKYDVIDSEMDQKVIALYAKGLTMSDIASYLKENDGMSISQSAISTITDKVYPLIKEWQSRPLSSLYTILYLDGLRFKVRDAGKIVNKCAYIILGIDTMGHKEVLGFWIAETEGAKFWMQILSELQHRGVEEILIACIDGLKGFGDAIKVIYPDATVQHCIVHQIRHTIKFVSHKDLESFCQDLKTVYTAPSEEAGKEALEKMEAKWQKYLPFLKTWNDKWHELAPFFSYPEALRRAMYTTNVIENLNRQFRKVTKTTVVFPHDESLMKLLWLAQDDIAKRWTMAIHNWGEIVSQLAILFPDKIEF